MWDYTVLSTGCNCLFHFLSLLMHSCSQQILATRIFWQLEYFATHILLQDILWFNLISVVGFRRWTQASILPNTPERAPSYCITQFFKNQVWNWGGELKGDSSSFHEFWSPVSIESNSLSFSAFTSPLSSEGLPRTSYTISFSTDWERLSCQSFSSILPRKSSRKHLRWIACGNTVESAKAITVPTPLTRNLTYTS